MMQDSVLSSTVPSPLVKTQVLEQLLAGCLIEKETELIQELKKFEKVVQNGTEFGNWRLKAKF